MFQPVCFRRGKNFTLRAPAGPFRFVWMEITNQSASGVDRMSRCARQPVHFAGISKVLCKAQFEKHPRHHFGVPSPILLLLMLQSSYRDHHLPLASPTRSSVQELSYNRVLHDTHSLLQYCTVIVLYTEMPPPSDCVIFSLFSHKVLVLDSNNQ
jgi:hypothetical protein